MEAFMSRRSGAGYKPVKNWISVTPSGCGINHNYFTHTEMVSLIVASWEEKSKWFGRLMAGVTGWPSLCTLQVCTAVVSVRTCAVTNLSKKLLQHYSGQKNHDQHPTWNIASCRLPATFYSVYSQLSPFSADRRFYHLRPEDTSRHGDTSLLKKAEKADLNNLNNSVWNWIKDKWNIYRSLPKYIVIGFDARSFNTGRKRHSEFKLFSHDFIRYTVMF